jgi:NADH-quinone oxidoreductase subunit J
MELALFYLFAALIVASSLAVVLSRNPMHSVLLLIASFVGLAALYIQLDSPFAAVTQIIVYAGAIIVLFLFVVMLLNAPREDAPTPYGPSYVSLTAGPRKVLVVLSVVMVAELVWALSGLSPRAIQSSPQMAAHVSSVREIGIALFTDHTLAFEVTSVLILVAMVGAVVLAKRRI